MSKQFAAFYVSWRDAPAPPWGLFANERQYGRAAALALAQKLNEIAAEGWIIDMVIPTQSGPAGYTAAFTIIAFK